MEKLFSEILESIEQRNPSILNNKNKFEIAGRKHSISRKENLPLPKISINLGAYNYNFSKDDNSFRYGTGNDEHRASNVEVVATINAKWSLTGSGGIFNTRKTSKSRFNKTLSLTRLQSVRHQLEVEAKKIHSILRSQEKKITSLKLKKENSIKMFNKIFDNYTNKKTRFSDFIHAFNNSEKTQLNLRRELLRHLTYKIQLANLAGLDSFSGHEFENLTRIK